MKLKRPAARRLPCRPDVAHPDEVEAAAAAAEREFGPIVIWINNAMVSVHHGLSHYNRDKASILGRMREEKAPDDPPAPVAALLENHRAFLRYLEHRVGDRTLAEDILQDVFAKVIARPQQAPDGEVVVPWFYRTLRNAAIDQFRRRGAADCAVELFARELETHAAPAPEMEAELCAYVSRLASTLKPEYAEALQSIDVQGIPVRTFGEQRGLSPNNAGVRVLRAREALKKRVTESCGTGAEHGCTDCTCRAHG